MIMKIKLGTVLEINNVLKSIINDTISALRKKEIIFYGRENY